MFYWHKAAGVVSDTTSEIALAAAQARASAAEGALVAAGNELNQARAVALAAEVMIRLFGFRSPNSGACNMATAPNAMPG